MTGPFALGPDLIDALQRVWSAPLEEAATGSASAVPPPERQLLRIDGVGVHQKTLPASEEPVPPLRQVLTGMASSRLPIAYEIDCSGPDVRFRLGTWLPPGATGMPLEVLTRLLRGAYPDVEAVTEKPVPPRAWPRSGLVLGIPGVPKVNPADGANPMHRLVRAMTGLSWSLLVLAEPVGDELARELRAGALEDMRLAAAAEAASGAPSPLRAFYDKVLTARLGSITDGHSIGYWRTAVYLAGDEASYPALTAAVRSVLAGDDAVTEPLRVHDGEQVGRWAAQWALPDVPGPEGAGAFRHPYACQSLMSSRELSVVVQLPDEEIPGFDVHEQPRFDVVPITQPDAGGLTLGRVVSGTTTTDAPYSVELRSLTRHVLTAGTTGSGKTNTVLAMLHALAEQDIPFLILEPAKSEYRALLADPEFGHRVQVFTPGSESVSPFRLNPFEVAPGESVATHLDLLRAAFNASFGMWTPLPQILEQCLHEVYTDLGWDLATDVNPRLGPSPASGEQWGLAFPTLSDLLAKVPVVVGRAGYDERIEADIRAALETRLRSLCVGGKGAMFDVAASVPMDALLGQPTVLELEWLGDDDDKALLMGLLLVRIAEHRRARGESAELVHVTVVEEAHRLLSRTSPRGSEEMADPRGRAVETFVNLLAEVRAYGEGIVVADQVPLRLAPEVLKNTNLKIAHRTIADEDRGALAGAMAMDEAQARVLTSLAPGRAAVFSGGDDVPLLVDVADVKDKLTAGRPDNAGVRERMAERAAPWLFSRPFCAQTCAPDLVACRTAQELTSDGYLRRTFARTALSLAENPAALDRMWDDLVATVRVRQPPLVDPDAVLRSTLAHLSDWYVRHRGAQAGWKVAVAAELGSHLRSVMLGRLSGSPDTAAGDSFRRLTQDVYGETSRSCGSLCAQAGPCLAAHAITDLIESGGYDLSWAQADAADAAAPSPTRVATWEVCQDAAYELVEFPEPDVPDAEREQVTAVARRAGLCFAQQMLARDQRKTPRTVGRILTLLVDEANGRTTEVDR